MDLVTLQAFSRRFFCLFLVAIILPACGKHESKSFVNEGNDGGKKRELTAEETIRNIILDEDLEKLKALLGKGLDVDFKFANGQTLLMFASESDKTRVLALLLKSGADLDLTNKDGKTALDLAASQKAICVLTDNAEPACQLGEKLIAAAKTGDWKEVQKLLSEGADVNSTNDDGQTALIIACKNNDSKLFRALISAHDLDLNIKDNQGRTALSYAKDHGESTRIVKWLEKNGAIE